MEEGDAAQRVPELRLDNVPMLSIVSPSKLEEGFKPKPHPVRPSTSDAQCMCHDTLLTDNAPLPAASSISSPAAPAKDTAPGGCCAAAAEHLLHSQENFVRRSGRAGAVAVRSIVRLRCPRARRSRRRRVAMRDVALTRIDAFCSNCFAVRSPTFTCLLKGWVRQLSAGCGGGVCSGGGGFCGSCKCCCGDCGKGGVAEGRSQGPAQGPGQGGGGCAGREDWSSMHSELQD